MNGLIGLAGVVALLLAAGTMIGCANRAHFSPRWLLIAALLVAVNDALLTSFYGLMPNFIGGGWNWQGKLLALTATLLIVTLPMFDRRRAGFTFSQEAGSVRAALPVALVYCALFVAVALAFDESPATSEDIAFQLTMPGLEEEPFYRGILLFALDQAFTARKRFLGVDWGWGAVLSCFLFGLTHGFGFSDGDFSFDYSIVALTAIPALLGVWLRLRTGSLLLPVLLHNFGNSFPLVI